MSRDDWTTKIHLYELVCVCVCACVRVFFIVFFLLLHAFPSLSSPFPFVLFTVTCCHSFTHLSLDSTCGYCPTTPFLRAAFTAGPRGTFLSDFDPDFPLMFNVWKLANLLLLFFYIVAIILSFRGAFHLLPIVSPSRPWEPFLFFFLRKWFSSQSLIKHIYHLVFGHFPPTSFSGNAEMWWKGEVCGLWEI